MLLRALLLALAPLGLAAASQSPVRERPDVVVIVADDLGWSDVFPRVATPNLEGLARSGVTFRSAYGMPTCSPARYAMLFGRYGRRAGLLAGVKKRALPSGVDEHEPFGLPRLFRSLGYSTAAFGKWHVDPPEVPAEALARRAGFQTFRAGTRGNLGRAPEAYLRWTRLDDGVESQSKEYATRAVGAAFREWWNEAEGPRFAWVAFHAPHQPFHVPPPELAGVAPNRTDARAMFEAAVRALDHEIGEVLAVLDRARTLVVFVSDNGTPPLAAAPGQDPARLKASTFEGGVRVPLVVAGPGIPPGECNALVAGVDLLATLAEHLGATLPAGSAEDSRSFAPLLHDPNAAGPRRTVFFEILGRTDEGTDEDDGAARDEEAVRSATHKLRCVARAGGRVEELYDLTLDPGELRPLDLSVPAHRAIRDQLARALAELPPRPGG